MPVPDLLLPLSFTVIALALGLAGVWRLYAARVAKLEAAVRALEAARAAEAASRAASAGHVHPLGARFPFDPRNFRFLGSPVGGVQFEDDRVVFVAFGPPGRARSEDEGRVRRLVEEKRVEWVELRPEPAAGASPAEPGSYPG